MLKAYNSKTEFKINKFFVEHIPEPLDYKDIKEFSELSEMKVVLSSLRDGGTMIFAEIVGEKRIKIEKLFGSRGKRENLHKKYRITDDWLNKTIVVSSLQEEPFYDAMIKKYSLAARSKFYENFLEVS